MRWTIYPEGAAPFVVDLPITTVAGDKVTLPDGTVQTITVPRTSVGQGGLRGAAEAMKGLDND